MRKKTVYALVFVFAGLAAAAADAVTPVEDARRILAALNLKKTFLAAGDPGAKYQSCIEREWAVKSGQLEIALAHSFGSLRLAQIADFLESPAGRTWNARDEVAALNKDSTTAARPLPAFAPGEQKAVERFMASPTGRDYIGIGRERNEYEIAVIALADELAEECKS